MLHEAQPSFNSMLRSPTNISPLPRAFGIIENVFEMPSCASSKGNFATEASDATAPFLSLPCIGFAPGAKGIPFFLPSGVLPVFLP